MHTLINHCILTHPSHYVHSDWTLNSHPSQSLCALWSLYSYPSQSLCALWMIIVFLSISIIMCTLIDHCILTHLNHYVRSDWSLYSHPSRSLCALWLIIVFLPISGIMYTLIDHCILPISIIMCTLFDHCMIFLPIPVIMYTLVDHCTGLPHMRENRGNFCFFKIREFSENLKKYRRQSEKWQMSGKCQGTLWWDFEKHVISWLSCIKSPGSQIVNHHHHHHHQNCLISQILASQFVEHNIAAIAKTLGPLPDQSTCKHVEDSGFTGPLKVVQDLIVF